MPASRRRPPAPIDPRGRDHTAATRAELAQTAERGWDRLERARKIPIERLAPNPDNPRTHYDELEPLANSIATRGILLPLLVRADLERPGYYLTIAGSRRLLAARMVAGRDDQTARLRVQQLPCIITDSDDRDAFADALLENMGRQDLSRAEMMVAVRRLRDEFSFSGKEIARRTGRNQSDIAQLLQLADDEELAPLVMDEVIAPTTAGVIRRMPEPVRREVLGAIREGEVFSTDMLRAHLRAVRSAPQPAEEFGDLPANPTQPQHGDNSMTSPAVAAGVVTSLPREAQDGLGVVTSLPQGAPDGRSDTGGHPRAARAETVPRRPADAADTAATNGSTPGAGRLRPKLVTLNNLAREIDAFCDRHDAGEFTPGEAASLVRAHQRLGAFLQRLGTG